MPRGTNARTWRHPHSETLKTCHSSVATKFDPMMKESLNHGIHSIWHSFCGTAYLFVCWCLAPGLGFLFGSLILTYTRAIGHR
jgi:hypothetical protein